MSEGAKKPLGESETESIGSTFPSDPFPAQIGEFRIESLISAGGMGSVYRAYDESMKRLVALKVLHPSLGLSTSGERFAREAWIMGQLVHDNIVQVYSRGQQVGVHYLSMELAEGGSLADALNHLRETVPDTRNIASTMDSDYVHSLLQRFVGLCEAVEYVHKKGFIHRDIKPHNILLTESSGRFKLTDFGIARSDDMTKMTRAGDFIGTVRYMSPELLAANRASIDKRTDIYSLGVTLYEALTLRLPYEGDTEERYVTEILAGRTVPVRRRHPRIPVDLETVILKATDHDPDRRYQTATAMSADLRAIIENRPITARRIGPFGRTLKFLKRHHLPIAIGAIFATVLATVGWYVDHDRSMANDKRRIVQTLQSCLATGKSPSELEPEWERLWPLLVESVQEGQDDSISIWFHRASCPRLPAQGEFVEKIVLLSKSVKISPASDEPFTPQFALVTRISAAADSAEYYPEYNAWCYYSVWRSAGSFGYEMNVERLINATPGLHVVRLRVISEHYRSVRLYVESRGIELPVDDNSVEISSPDLPVFARDPILGNEKQPFLIDTNFATYTVMQLAEHRQGSRKPQ